MHLFHTIAESRFFNALISIAIIGNTLCLALDRFNISQSEFRNLENVNTGFTALFFLEMIIKLIGLGFKEYFKDSFNTFDCIIVIISSVDLVLTYSLALNASGGAISAFRGFRLLRLFKLAKSWKKF